MDWLLGLGLLSCGIALGMVIASLLKANDDKPYDRDWPL